MIFLFYWSDLIMTCHSFLFIWVLFCSKYTDTLLCFFWIYLILFLLVFYANYVAVVVYANHVAVLRQGTRFWSMWNCYVLPSPHLTLGSSNIEGGLNMGLVLQTLWKTKTLTYQLVLPILKRFFPTTRAHYHKFP
jgi:hypothetical protein